MKIVLAFDSFKNCLSSPEICRILRESLLAAEPSCEVLALPLGDGGEGTARAVVNACGGEIFHCPVHDPLFRMTDAEWGLLPDGSAIFEMASASGIELISRAERDPMKTTTYGTGELLRHLACEKSIRKFCIGIGGSATVDGGVGMLQALGVKFYDANRNLLPVPADGNAIGRIRFCDVSEVPPEVRSTEICIASDVNNPLCGESGAARVFAPQKGADPAMVEVLEQNLFNFGQRTVSAGIADGFDHPGDGAAGGVGFALRSYLNARTASGAELVLDLLDFDRKIADADLVMTGEGRSDFQTAHGKLCRIVSEHARKAGVPVILLSGALGERFEELEPFFDGLFALSSAPCPLEEALENTPENLRRMGRAILNLLRLPLKKTVSAQ
ncbi:MAG: glycerate kinase [Lentisphaeria bacterium]|nr:glycerate kinase [Lentisphaeria bacterium]